MSQGAHQTILESERRNEVNIFEVGRDGGRVLVILGIGGGVGKGREDLGRSVSQPLVSVSEDGA